MADVVDDGFLVVPEEAGAQLLSYALCLMHWVERFLGGPTSTGHVQSGLSPRTTQSRNEPSTCPGPREYEKDQIASNAQTDAYYGGRVHISYRADGLGIDSCGRVLLAWFVQRDLPPLDWRQLPPSLPVMV